MLLGVLIGFCLTPLIYFQGYLYSLLDVQKEDPSKIHLFSKEIFMLFVVVISFILISFCYLLKSFLFQGSYSVFFYLCYYTIFLCLFELGMFFVHKQKIESFNILLFSYLLLIVSGINYTVLIMGVSWLQAVFALIGMSLGLYITMLVTKNFYQSLLIRYCHPIFKNPAMSISISYFIGSLLYLFSKMV